MIIPSAPSLLGVTTTFCLLDEKKTRLIVSSLLLLLTSNPRDFTTLYCVSTEEFGVQKCDQNAKGVNYEGFFLPKLWSL